MFVPFPIVRKYHTFKFVGANRNELLPAIVGVDCCGYTRKGGPGSCLPRYCQQPT